jgi:hypothetical protein
MWYNVKILGKEVNWASVGASVVIFVGLEMWRRKYIATKIKEDIRLAMTKMEDMHPDDKQEQTMTFLDKILNEIG